jgi:hypothetical protein
MSPLLLAPTSKAAETQMTSNGLLMLSLRPRYQFTRQNYDRCFFHPAITTEDGFFSSTTEPNAVKIVQGVAAGFSLQSQNQTRCKLYRELQ